MADINFDCPHCGHNLDVNERGAGLTVACPECSKNIQIPVPELRVSDIVFNCGSCGQPLKAAPDIAGQLIDCPVCKKPTEIPFPPRPTPPTPTRPAARSTPIPKPPSQSQVPGFGTSNPAAPVATSPDLSTDNRSHITCQSSGGAGLGWFLSAVGIAAIIGGLILNSRYTDQENKWKDRWEKDTSSTYAYKQWQGAQAKGGDMLFLAVSGGFVIALGGWLITRKKS